MNPRTQIADSIAKRMVELTTKTANAELIFNDLNESGKLKSITDVFLSNLYCELVTSAKLINTIFIIAPETKTIEPHDGLIASLAKREIETLERIFLLLDMIEESLTKANDIMQRYT